MTFFVFGLAAEDPGRPGAASLIPDYFDEIALADNPDALLDHLDVLLTYGTLSDESKATIITLLDDIPLTDPSDPNYNGPGLRVGLAVLMILTAPDYIVQREDHFD